MPKPAISSEAVLPADRSIILVLSLKVNPSKHVVLVVYAPWGMEGDRAERQYSPARQSPELPSIMPPPRRTLALLSLANSPRTPRL